LEEAKVHQELYCQEEEQENKEEEEEEGEKNTLHHDV
jgi:hypothetical protein